MNLRKISDVAASKQTDELKMLIYNQIQQFVYKYQPRYWPSFKGELNDLALDIFEEFCRPKKHRNGEVFSELDRLDPSVVGNGNWTGDEKKAIATYTQRFVTHTLIDKARTDKHEVLATENFDENHKGLTLDRAASGNTKQSTGDDGMVGGAYIENITYYFHDLMDNPVALKNAKQRLSHDPKQVKYIRSLVKHYGDRLDPEVAEFALNLANSIDPQLEPVKPVKQDFSELEKATGANVSVYSLQKKPAIRLEFPDKESLKKADKEAITSMLPGYTYYTSNGAKMYFFKND